MCRVDMGLFNFKLIKKKLTKPIHFWRLPYKKKKINKRILKFWGLHPIA